MPILLRRLTCFLSFDPPGKDLKDFYEQIPIILRELVARLNDENGEVLKTTHMAFSALSKHVPAEELVNHVEFMRNQISSLVSDARRRKGGVGDGEFLLPGFNIPKGPFPESCNVLAASDVMTLFLHDWPTEIVGASTISLSDRLSNIENLLFAICTKLTFPLLLCYRSGATLTYIPTWNFVWQSVH